MHYGFLSLGYSYAQKSYSRDKYYGSFSWYSYGQKNYDIDRHKIFIT
jgi:hypothetical protein